MNVSETRLEGFKRQEEQREERTNTINNTKQSDVSYVKVNDLAGLCMDNGCSDEFSCVVKDRLYKAFVSTDKNQMSFFDVWNVLGKTISRSRVEEELEKLVNEGILSVTNGIYHYEFASILDVIEILPEKYRDVISLKLSGLKYDEIAYRYGVTKEYVQKLTAKGMTAIFRGAKGIVPVARVKEDDDKVLFQKYNISIGEWISDLKKPEYAYRYLAMRYKKGTARLPGAKKKSSYKEFGEPQMNMDAVEADEFASFLEYYKGLAGVQRKVLLYSNEKQYLKDINRLSERLEKEIKKIKKIGDVKVAADDYSMLRNYLHYAVKLLNNTSIHIDDAMFVTAVTKVVERTYTGNLWGCFFKEIGVRQTHYLQTLIGRKYFDILERFDLLRDKEGRFCQSVLMQCNSDQKQPPN